jgi:hypothetical protein
MGEITAFVSLCYMPAALKRLLKTSSDDGRQRNFADQGARQAANEAYWRYAAVSGEECNAEMRNLSTAS